MNLKEWFRANIKQYLRISDEKTTNKIETAKTELRQEFKTTSVTGTFKGGFATINDMPSKAKNGDWAVLTADFPDEADAEFYESGIYVKSSSGWSFVADITSFDEVQAILATDREFDNGTTTQKAVTVKQLYTAFDGVFSDTITPEEAQADWDSV